MPRVWNKRDVRLPRAAIYVGRPTKWGNPFSHKATGTLALFRVASRNEAITRYESYIMARPDLVRAAREELRGKDLVCYCAPARCHADILMRIANEDATYHR